jgi:hypothetical protein
MNPGDQVTIYYDPFTCKQPEGKATLIKRISVFRIFLNDGKSDLKPRKSHAAET